MKGCMQWNHVTVGKISASKAIVGVGSAAASRFCTRTIIIMLSLLCSRLFSCDILQNLVCQSFVIKYSETVESL